MVSNKAQGGSGTEPLTWRKSFETYRRLFGYVRPYRRRFAMALVCSVLAGASTAVLYIGLKTSTALVLRGQTGLKRTVPILGEIDLDRWLSQFTQGAGISESLTLVILACLTIPCLMLVRGLFDFLSVYLFGWIQNRMTLDLRTEAFAKTLAQSIVFFNKQRSGDLIQSVSSLTSSTAGASMTLTQNVVRRPAAVLSVVIALLVTDPVFMAFTFLVFPLCMLPVIVLSRRVRRASRTEQQETANLMSFMQEAFNGIRVVKSHAREAFELDRFVKTAQIINKNTMRTTRVTEVVGPLVESTASLGIAGGLFYCWWRGVPFDEFMARCVALIALYPEAKALSRTHLVMQNCITSSDRLFQLLDAKPAVQDSPQARTLSRARGDLQFKGVSHRYGEASAPAVEDISLEFAHGKFYALVGESGAGKSTLMSLVLRFYDPQAGQILLDGVDLRDIQQASLREQIGIVNQDLFLFHDTIENNIRYGRPGASFEEVQNAARTAHAHQFILNQPEGYQTVVGDKGCNLSGGQQQRLTIARAILRNAPILLLDEATSNLDPETEQAFRDALRVLRVDRTVLAIAHRFSTILEADEIIVMDKGRVVSRGSHSELMSRSEIYQRLYKLQFEAEQVA
jgi:subfamily B ATP-binding cassette protein MsbA